MRVLIFFDKTSGDVKGAVIGGDLKDSTHHLASGYPDLDPATVGAMVTDISEEDYKNIERIEPSTQAPVITPRTPIDERVAAIEATLKAKGIMA